MTDQLLPDDRRTDLYSTSNSSAAERQIAELLSALRILTRIARVPQPHHGPHR